MKGYSFFPYIYLIVFSFLYFNSTHAQHTKIYAGTVIDSMALYEQKYHLQQIILKEHMNVSHVSLIIENINPDLNAVHSYSKNTQLDFFIGQARDQKVVNILIPYYVEKDLQKGTLENYQLALTLTSDLSSTQEVNTLQSATSSLLSTGTWYKISVPHQGLFKIDRNFLSSNGIPIEQVNFQHLRIFGHGGGVIDEIVTNDQPDDLMEIAMYYSSDQSSMSAQDYVLFYSTGPTTWEKNGNYFKHRRNYYEDKSYYFLTFDHGAGKHIEHKDYLSESIQEEITTSDDYYFYQVDNYHPSGMGKQWYSQRLNSASSPNMTYIHNLPVQGAVGTIQVQTRIASQSHNTGAALFYVDNQLNLQENLYPSGDSYKIREKLSTLQFDATGQEQAIKFQFQLAGNSNAYIGFIEANFQKPIKFNGNSVWINTLKTADYTEQDYIGFKIINAPNNIQIWNVSDHNEVYSLAFNAGQSIYKDQAGRVQNYYAFTGNQFPSPSYIGGVANQNLHALPATQYLMIAPNEFLSHAHELAAFHREYYGTEVTVVDLKKIYNEFSSGSQDIAAIRNFIRMMYERGQEENRALENVLLFGAASYDYKNIIQPNTNFVPTFQTLNSEGYVSTYPTDDFYAILDEGETINSLNAYLDVGIGRIPATSTQEAQNMVNKIKNYHSAASFGTWKMQASLVADDRETGMNHLADCESIAQPISSNQPGFTLHKIYSDAHNVVAGASGNRYPTMNQAINERIFQGTFYMSYSGHGSPLRWSHEAILTGEDYSNWRNINALPLMITATCDFGRYDEPNPEQRSAGTKIVLNDRGGAIAMITTTQAVYSSSSTQLTRGLVDQLFKQDQEGQYQSIGLAYINGKNFNLGQNASKFALLGDPGMQLGFPKHKVILSDISEINGDQIQTTDTLKALGQYRITGQVVQQDDQALNDFNGEVTIRIYGQEESINTVNSFPGTTPSFAAQTNLIVNQKGIVENGQFSLDLIISKDINYDFGSAKITLYAHNAQEDAMGYSTEVTLGGYSNHWGENNIPPTVKVHLYDSLYHYSGFTDPNPVIFVALEDDIGFNISGSSIGHDLIGILDEDFQNPYILNNFFESSTEGPHKGYLYYPLYNLPEGEHVITIRAWDVHNNMGEGHVRFEVKKQHEDSLSIQNLHNFPNPFHEETNFVFEHNLKNLDLEVHINIYDIAGRKVQTLQKNIAPASNKVYVPWTGRDANDLPLSKGIYFYQADIISNGKVIDSAYEKLLLLR